MSSVAIWLTTLWVSGISVTEVDEPWQQVAVFVVVGAVFAGVNALIKPLVKTLTFLLYILTLGLFALVVNALMLMLTGWVTGFLEWGLSVDGFWTAVWGGLIIAVISAVLNLVLPDGNRRRR